MPRLTLRFAIALLTFGLAAFYCARVLIIPRSRSDAAIAKLKREAVGTLLLVALVPIRLLVVDLVPAVVGLGLMLVCLVAGAVLLFT